MKLSDVLHYYLPYNIEMVSPHEGRSAYITTIKRRLKKSEILTADLYDVMIFLKRKPILKPLSSFNNGQFNNDMVREIVELREGVRTISSLHFSTVKLCLENHLDIFGLIPEGLAIEKK